MPAVRLQQLYQQRRDLLQQEAQAATELAAAEAAYRPDAEAFRQAHAACFSAAVTHRLQTTKAERTAAYDARLAAGHAAWPSKSRFQAIETWHSHLLRELKLLNAEIERASSKSPHRQPSLL